MRHKKNKKMKKTISIIVASLELIASPLHAIMGSDGKDPDVPISSLRLIIPSNALPIPQNQNPAQKPPVPESTLQPEQGKHSTNVAHISDNTALETHNTYIITITRGVIIGSALAIIGGHLLKKWCTF